MSDSKKDLTRIEDLGEYLHQLDDDKDYLPELPNEDPPAFMEETLISEDSSFTETTPEDNFESDLNSFSSEESFGGDTFESESFENTDFSSDSAFDSNTSFDSESSFGEETPFENNDPFTSSNDLETGIEGADLFSTSEEDEEDEENRIDPFEGQITEEESAEVENSSFIDDAEVAPTPSLELPPIEDEPVIEKRPLPEVQISPPIFQTPENFEDVKKFAESSNFTGMASEGNPSFSVLLKEIKYIEDAQDILALLKELGLAMDTDEVLTNRLNRGDFLIPRISEFAATLLAHKLRRFDIDILVGPSDGIQPPKHAETAELGLVSKQSLYQNQSHHFQFDEFNLDISQIIISATPSLDGYQVIKYLGVATEHKMLEGHLVEDENSLEISSHYQELAQKLKAHALKNHANAVVGLNYQLTPLPSQYATSHTRYRLTCTGNLVWINKI